MVREIVIRFHHDQAVIVVNETIMATADEYGTVSLSPGLPRGDRTLETEFEGFLDRVEEFMEWLVMEKMF